MLTYVWSTNDEVWIAGTESDEVWIVGPCLVYPPIEPMSIFRFAEEQVNKSALNICQRYLDEGKEWPSSDEVQ